MKFKEGQTLQVWWHKSAMPIKIHIMKLIDGMDGDRLIVYRLWNKYKRIWFYKIEHEYFLLFRFETNKSHNDR